MGLQTTSFKIARYILFALVLILCAWIIIYTLVSKEEGNTMNINDENVIRVTNNQNPCEQNINNSISQMWAYNFENVPQKYLSMIDAYVNEEITTRETGYCNNVKFTCTPGQIRKDCDPCAAGSARQFAMDKQIADTIAQECK